MNDELKQFYNESLEVEELSEVRAKRVKEKVFARLGEAVQEEPPIVSLLEKLRRLFLHSYILAPLVLILFVTGTAYASADSLPGDTLYPVKRGVEDMRLFVAPTQEAKLQLQEAFAQKRLDELNEVETKDSEGTKAKQDLKPDHQTKVEIDGKDVRSNDDQDESQQDQLNQNRRARQTQARHEANQALDQLRQTGETWGNRGNKEKAQEIQDKVNRFRNELRQHGEDQTDNHQEGEDGNEFHSSSESLTPLLK